MAGWPRKALDRRSAGNSCGRAGAHLALRLLRPVFQDQILPTSAYIGGPAEIAYFAQSAVLYRRILGRLTPVLPRLSATLVEPAIAELLDRHELTLEAIFSSTEETLAQHLAARAMPIAESSGWPRRKRSARGADRAHRLPGLA